MQLVLSAFYTKNLYEKIQYTVHKEMTEMYVTILGGRMQEDQDFKIIMKGHRAEITDLQTNETATMNVRDFELEYGSILRMKINNENHTT
jgi:hypothetical protein